MNDKSPLPAKHKLNPLVKLALDVGPLVVFFAANARFEIFTATAIFMAAVLAALAVSFALTRHLAIMPVVSLLIVLVFGTLTIVLHDETFIKVKPTIIYLLFAVTLYGGYLFNKPLLAIVFDAAFHLTEEGWRRLTLRWATFFVFMAVVNELVWRTQTTQFWLGFKFLGAIPLTLVFAMLQHRLLMRYASEQPNAAAEAEREEVS
jgi:intracellular septation protein